MNLHFRRTLLFLVLAASSNAVNAKPFIYATTGENAITIIDAGNNSIANTIPLTDFGSKLAVTPDGKFVYVLTGRSITVIDTTERRLHTTIPLCCNFYGIVAAPDGASVYVTGVPYNSVAVIDTKLNYVSAIFSAGKGSHTITITTKAGFSGAIKLDRIIVTTDLNFDPNKWLSGK
ncbi:MAG TPA: YncE family protein [Pyrinomonadaceae bacterium]|jgi:YVTN family beta-propeller protein|nr:YncE family protein [Pyrinomonadaceae bacterium]